MIAELEAAVETEMFTTLVDVSLTDQDSSASGGWRSDTRLHVLAFEITRYMPELAAGLSRAGLAKLKSAA
jgi:hypothetical protein